VKDKVREDLIKKKAIDAAQQKAAAMASAVKTTPGDFAKAAKAAGVEVKSTELVARGSALPDIGQSDAVDAAAFALPPGAVSDPISTDNAIVIARVVERKDVTPAELTAARTNLRDELLNERKSRFYSAYMAKAKTRMKIRVDRETLRAVVT
jgi:peptidyl-prolyl cis-trans isomerase D